MNGEIYDKKTILYRILKYAGIILFLLFLLLPAKYINTVFGYLPFLFVFFILLISVVGMMILRRNMIVESDFNDAECIRGSAVRVSLKVRNRSVFVCPKARAAIYISDLFGNADEETEIDFAMTAGTVNDFSFDMDMIHIGTYYVGIRRLSVFDMTGLFQVNVPVRDQFRVNVTPRIRALEEMEVTDDVLAESENDTRIASAGGMNYTGVREYEFGDSMKQIHWKLSAHSATYMTKINEINRQNDYVIVLDMAAPSYGTEELMDINDTLIETAVSVLERLSTRDVSYSLIFPDRNRDIQRVMPSAGDYSEIVRELCLLTPSPDVHFPDGTRLLEDEGSVMTRSANVIICSSLVTDAMIRRILEIRQQGRTPELFYIFPERLNSREREKLEAPLEELSMAGIDYHVVSTIVNRSYDEETTVNSQYRRTPERRQPDKPDKPDEEPSRNYSRNAASERPQGQRRTRREESSSVRRRDGHSRTGSASRQRQNRKTAGATFFRTNRTGNRPGMRSNKNGGERQ